MRPVNLICLSVGWLSAILGAGASPNGTLSGLVVDDKGAPISSALVVYRSVPVLIQTANGEHVMTGPAVGGGVKTASDGSFSVSALPPATYHLCAYGTNDNQLGSCEWGQGTLRVDLAAGQTTQLKFVIAEGTLLTFQIEDPRHQVLDLESLQVPNGRLPLSGANFAVGVWAGSRYARARLVSTNGSTRYYQLAIPKTAVVRLYLDTTLAVLDSSNVAVPVRSQSKTISAGGQAAATMILTVP